MNENFGNGFENNEERFNSENAEQVDFVPAEEEQGLNHTTVREVLRSYSQFLIEV